MFTLFLLKAILSFLVNYCRFYVDDDLVLSTPDPPIDQNQCWTGFYDFGYPEGDLDNPWTDEKTCHSYMAPFDQEVSR